jgi:uncharacterized protein YheU (UPF0270 family)
VIEVPWQDIEAETLDALIEEFVTREGTEYGEQDVPLSRKVAQIREQLRRGDVCIVFEEAMQSVNLLTRRDFRARLRQLPAEDG